MPVAATDLFARPAHNPSFFAVSAAAPADRPLLDFCVPVNLHYPRDALLTAVTARLGDIVKYYPDYAEVHQAHLAALAGVPAEHIVAANGSTEIITDLVRVAQGPLVTCAPTFGQWTDLPRTHGLAHGYLFRRREQGFRLDPEDIVRQVRAMGARSLVLSNPNNPTGVGMPLEEVRFVAESLADLPLVAIDESFIDFSGHGSAATLAAASDNLVVVKSLGKTLGLHGVRLGYAVAGLRMAEAIRRRLPCWNINGLAAAVLAHVAARPDVLAASLAATAADRDAMAAALADVPGLAVYPSDANFLMAELIGGASGTALRERLLTRHGVFIRECGNKIGSSSRYLRLAVARPPEVAQLVAALRAELGG